jgi:Prp8 binding protein
MSLSLVTQTPDSLQPGTVLEGSSHTLALSGHSGEVFSCDFTHDGEFAASAGFDRAIYLWNVSDGFSNCSILRGHSNGILQVRWSGSDATKLMTASADKSVAWWDAIEGARIKKLVGHTSIVNACATSKTGPALGVSGADDGTVKLWDMRERKCVGTFEHSYQVLSVELSESSDRVFAGTIDDSILILDPRKLDEPLDTLTTENDIDSVTGLSLSSDGDSLLSLSMNGSAHLWDVRPFCATDDRLQYTYHKIGNNFGMNLLRIRWSPDDLLFGIGSSAHTVNIHKVRPGIDDMDTLVYALPGHEGVVSEVVFHPNERYAVLSASSDKSLIYGSVVA